METLETKIIAVVSQKGGTGKSTNNIMLATNLLAHFKKKVVLFDFDIPQYSIANKKEKELATHEHYLPKVDYPVEMIDRADNNIVNALKKYFGKVDYIILDFPGNINKDMLKGIGYLDYAFCPLTFDDLELDASIAFYELLVEHYLNNEKKPLKEVYLFFNQYEKIKKNAFQDLREMLLDQNIKMLDSNVFRRTIYKDVYRSLIYPIPKNKENKKDEYKSFIKEVLKITSK